MQLITRMAGWSLAPILMSGAFTLGQAPPALPSIETVTYDQRGVFHVNGKPFFPIALYDAPFDDRTLAELRDHGFNVLACDAKSCAALPAKGFYGMVHTSKKMDDLRSVFIGLGADSPALNFRKNLLQQVADANAKTREAVSGRPIMNAIGYWENEPAGVIKGTLPSKAVYEDLVSAIDVSAPYLYPVPYQPIASVADAVARARKATGGKKPILPVLQLFVWDVKDRYPTPAELRCMAYLALVEGAHGMGYYSYGSVTGRPKMTIPTVAPELWQSVKKLNHEIADIGPRLWAGVEAQDLMLRGAAPSVRIKQVREKTGLLAVLVNSGPTAQEVTLNWQPKTQPRLLASNGKPLAMKDGAIAVTLPPFGVETIQAGEPR